MWKNGNYTFAWKKNREINSRHSEYINLGIYCHFFKWNFKNTFTENSFHEKSIAKLFVFFIVFLSNPQNSAFLCGFCRYHFDEGIMWEKQQKMLPYARLLFKVLLILLKKSRYMTTTKNRLGIFMFYVTFAMLCRQETFNHLRFKVQKIIMTSSEISFISNVWWIIV